MFRLAGASAVLLALSWSVLPNAAAPVASAELFAQAAAPSAEQPQSRADALHAAVRLGKIDEVKQLIAQGTDVNARDALGSTPLLDAAWMGNSDIARVLLMDGADANARGASGSTPLQYAVLAGHAATVKLLLEAGASLDTRYRDAQTVLHLAAARGNPAIVELLATAHADINSPDANGNTPLDAAVLHGQLAAVSCLLAHRADIHHLHPQDGRGPLHEASIKGFAGLVAPLLARGADPAQRDHFGQTPLDLALAYKNASVVSALLHLESHGNAIDSTAEHAMESATLRGQTEIVRMLIDGGFDIRKPTASGSTYLHDAALKGQKTIVQLLLDHGAALEAVDQTGATPLHDAALGGSVEVISLLLDSGALIEARDRETGATPLMFAAGVGRAPAVALLLSRGANPRLRDKAGHTALDRARESDENPAIDLLEAAMARSKSHPAGKVGA